MSILTIHLYVAFIVAALALLAVWRLPERRVTLYVVTLQILLGIVLVVRGLRAPSTHYALAILGWAGYMAANALSRRPERRSVALAVAGVSSLLILLAYYVGMHAVKTGYVGG